MDEDSEEESDKVKKRPALEVEVEEDNELAISPGRIRGTLFTE